MGKLIISLFTLVGMLVVGLVAVAVGLFVFDEYQRKRDAAPVEGASGGGPAETAASDDPEGPESAANPETEAEPV